MSTRPVIHYIKAGINELFDHLSDRSLNPNHSFSSSACVRVARVAITPLVEYAKPQSWFVGYSLKVILGAGVTCGLNIYYGDKKWEWIEQFATEMFHFECLRILRDFLAESFPLKSVIEVIWVVLVLRKLDKRRRRNLVKGVQVAGLVLACSSFQYSRVLRKQFPKLSISSYFANFLTFHVVSFLATVVFQKSKFYSPEVADNELDTKDKLINALGRVLAKCFAIAVTIQVSQKVFHATIYTKWDYPKIIVNAFLPLIKS